jgi:hypothetical protein
MGFSVAAAGTAAVAIGAITDLTAGAEIGAIAADRAATAEI